MRFVIALFLLVGAPFAQIASPPLRVPGPWTKPAFDPHRSADPAHFRIFAQLYETPLELAMDARERLSVGAGAFQRARIEEGGLRCTFALAEPVSRYHDDPCFDGGKGRPVRPKDLAQMFLRHADPAMQSPYWNTFLRGRIVGLDDWRALAERTGTADYDAEVTGLIATDQELVVRLVTPYPQFEGLLTQTFAALVPREATARYGTGFSEHPVGSGPFRLEGIDALGTIRFVAHSGHRRAKDPIVRELRFESIPEPERRTERLLAGDLAWDVLSVTNRAHWLEPDGTLKKRHQTRGFTLATGPALEVMYIAINFDRPEFQNAAFREALALAVDRSRFAALSLGDKRFALDGPIPPGLPEANAVDALPPHRQLDLNKAQAALERAGFPRGAGAPPLLLDAPGLVAGTPYAEAIELLVAGWRALGLEVSVRGGEFPAFLEAARRGDFQLACMRWYADYPDVENFLGLFRSAPDPVAQANYGRFSDPEVDQLFDDIARLTPGPARVALIANLVRRLQSLDAWIFLAAPREQVILAPGVSGYRPNFLAPSLHGVRAQPPRRPAPR